MSNYINQFGLGFIIEDEERTRWITGEIVEKADRRLEGYSGNVVFQKKFGSSEFSIRTEKQESGEYEVTGLDTHCCNTCVWNTIVETEMSYEDGDCNNRLLLVHNYDNHGGAIVNVINADVIPSYVEGDQLTIQVIALATSFDVFESEDVYHTNMNEYGGNKSIRQAVGTIFPIGIMMNQDKDNIENNPLNIVCGRIKAIRSGEFIIDEEKKVTTFFRIVVDTDFGELEIGIGADSIPDGYEDKIHKDSIILASVVISADPAIFDYDKGIVLNEENNLRVIRHAIEHGEEDRLARILSQECIYTSEIGGWNKSGISEIVELFKYVAKQSNHIYRAHMATLIERDCGEELEYAPGKRCLILESEDVGLESLVFLECNEDGLVTQIKVSGDSRYKFNIDGNNCSEEEEE